ncbi:cytochrome c oxidase assembly factor 8-like isoform X2 [Hyalella azteca]|uniref:Cytochrome c oxidase assembly factor 8-like isoform X2 n=1 Tax=Hyalella azteca TaxID=294128 RepID=A0A979FKV1_HYAAZ|nr:cytochrome c oxidase assembly factor 8-like isoform X2 [Hyalella azteca]
MLQDFISNLLQGLDHKTVVQAVQRQEDRDYVGPPHPVSKLRPVLYCTAKQETPLQAAHRTSLLETQSWNQNYWLQHNTAFEKEKQAFITKKLSEKYSIASRHGNEDQLTLTSEEMAEFYKQFLDQNFDQHMQYNREWYKRNFKHIIMAAKVWIESKRR